MDILDPGCASRPASRLAAALGILACSLHLGVAHAQAQVGLSTPSITFGGQSMGTSSPPAPLTITNTGNATLTIASISSTQAQFTVSGTCTSVAPGASCPVSVTFTPTATGGALHSTTNVTGTLNVASNASGSPHGVALSGTGEKSLITHYYQSILRRAPEASGKLFWQGEASRVQALAANVNEVWFAMAMTFYFSPEYTAFNTSNNTFVTDLYRTFFNRAPDSGGLTYWMGQLSSGMPREVLLASFMFSPEFVNFTQAIFGNTAARAEIDVVGDFYRGLLARLPDDGGFAHWVQQFRTAQCSADASNQVRAQAGSISAGFANGPEYNARARSNAQFVGDLYNSFLRRGGDLPGVQFWIDALNSGQQTRDSAREFFLQSPEFTARVNAVAAAGCFSSSASLRVSVGGFGHVSSSPSGIACGSVPASMSATGTKCFAPNLSGNVTLTATPFNANFKFDGWAGDTTCTTGASCSVPMSGAKWVKAKFSPMTTNGNVCQGLGLVSDKLDKPLSNSFPNLALGQSFVDPKFGTTIRRITNVTGDGRGANTFLVPAYSTISAWNADESYLILYRAGGNSATRVHELYNGKTYAFIRALNDLPYVDIEQFYWDTTRPNILYGADNSNDTLYEYNVDAPAGSRLTAIRSFQTQCGSRSITGGDDPFFNSFDSKVFAFACETGGAMFSYNRATDTVGTLSPTGAAQPRATSGTSPQATPSGTRLFVNQPKSASGPNGAVACGGGSGNTVRVYDLNMVAGACLDMDSGDEHGATNLNFNGTDSYNTVHFGDGPSGTGVGSVVQWNMQGTPNGQNRIPGRILVGESNGYPYPPSGTHISGNSFNRTGQIAVSVIGDPSGANLLDQELLFIDGDPATNPGNHVCRVGHHRSNTHDEYFAEPHPSISPSGTRIVFGSSWGNATGSVVNAYVVELPGYKP